MPNTIMPNLGPVKAWSTLLLANLFKQGEPMFSGSADGRTWKDGRTFPVDADGYPTAIAPDQAIHTVFSAGLDLHWGDGLYNATWDGVGTIAVGGAATLVSSAANSAQIRVTSTTNAQGRQNGQWTFTIKTTGPAPNHMRNIDIRKASTPAGEMFDPDYLSLLRSLPFSGIRTLQPLDTDREGGKVADWNNRAKLSDAQWTQKGWPFEVSFALANRMGAASVYINVPHAFTDDAVRSLAAFLRPYLVSGREVLIEYTNETFNGGINPTTGLDYGYPQAAYCIRQGQARHYDYVSYPTLTGRTDFNLGSLRFYGARACEVFDLIRSGVGPTLSRFATFVIGSLAANAWNSSQTLDFKPQGQTLAVGQRANALAVAPYPALNFGDDAHRQARIDAILGQSIDATFAELRANMDALFAQTPTQPGQATPIRTHAANAARYGLRFIAYEGSASLVVPNQPGVLPAQAQAKADALVDLYRRMNLDPRMGTFITDLLTNWSRYSTDIFSYFCLVAPEGGGQVGSFGAKRYVTEPDNLSPKWQALRAFTLAHPRT